MLLRIFAFGAGMLVSFVVYQVIFTIKRNWIAQRTFRSKLPNLPMLPNTSVFSGNSYDLYYPLKNWKLFDEAHKKYGTTFGWFLCGQPAVSTYDLDLIRKMILDEPYKNINRVEMNIPVAQVRENSIAFTRDEQWHRLRKAIAPAFTNHKIMSPNVQHEIDSIINRLIDFIEVKLAQNMDGFYQCEADDMFSRFSLDLIFKCFYKQDNLIDYYKEEDPFVKLIDDALKAFVNPFVFFCVTFPVVIPLIEWLSLHFHTTGLMVHKVTKFIKEQTSQHLRAEKEADKSGKLNQDGSFDKDNFVLNDGTRFRRNLVDYIIDQFRFGNLNKTEFMNSTFFLFHAATKTTADGLCKLAYNLAAHPGVQDKLRDAILVDGVKSEYLHWCISESLRLYPPVMGGSSRELGRDIDTKIGLIPAGTVVATPVFTVNRCKEVWGPNADEFKPDRWSNAKNFHPAQYLSFGLGKRNCLGKDFALNVIKKLMVELISRYRFLLTPENDPEAIMDFGAPGFIFLSSGSPIYIRISPLLPDKRQT